MFLSVHSVLTFLLKVSNCKPWSLVICCGVDSPGVSSVREVIGALLLHHTCQLVSNAHAITTVLRLNNSSAAAAGLVSTGELSSTHTLSRVDFNGGDSDVGSLAVDTSQQVRLATAVYPTASLMNHSCEPSIISRCHLLHCGLLQENWYLIYNLLTYCQCLFRGSVCISTVLTIVLTKSFTGLEGHFWRLS